MEKRERLLNDIKQIREQNKICFVKMLEELKNLVKEKGGKVELSEERYVQVISENSYGEFLPFIVTCLYITDDTLYAELRGEGETIECPIIELELSEILCLIEEVVFV